MVLFRSSFVFSLCARGSLEGDRVPQNTLRSGTYSQNEGADRASSLYDEISDNDAKLLTKVQNDISDSAEGKAEQDDRYDSNLIASANLTEREGGENVGKKSDVPKDVSTTKKDIDESGEWKRAEATLKLGPFQYQQNESLVQLFYIWNRSLTPVDRHRKFCVMQQSPFRFYRGSDHQFFEDFTFKKRQFPEVYTKFEYYPVWIQGDLHTQNLGTLQNANGEVVYNVNDFDEAVESDYQFDVWRLAIAICLTNREEELLKRDEEKFLIQQFTDGYMGEIHGLLPPPGPSVSPEISQFVKEVTAHADNKEYVLDKWAPINKYGHRKFKRSEKLSACPQDIQLLILRGMADYYRSLSSETRNQMNFLYFQVKDIAQRNLQGTGSLGAGRYYVLIEGPTLSPNDDIILDFKQQMRPAPFYYLGLNFMNSYTRQFRNNDALRHNMAMDNLLGPNSDKFNGYFIDKRKGISYSVRQRSAYDDSLDFGHYKGKKDSLGRIFKQFGQIIAIDHRNSGGNPFQEKLQSFDPQEWHELVWSIAASYSNQVDVDAETFRTGMLASDESDCDDPTLSFVAKLEDAALSMEDRKTLEMHGTRTPIETAEQEKQGARGQSIFVQREEEAEADRNRYLTLPTEFDEALHVEEM